MRTLAWTPWEERSTVEQEHWRWPRERHTLEVQTGVFPGFWKGLLSRFFNAGKGIFESQLLSWWKPDADESRYLTSSALLMIKSTVNVLKSDPLKIIGIHRLCWNVRNICWIITYPTHWHLLCLWIKRVYLAKIIGLVHCFILWVKSTFSRLKVNKFYLRGVTEEFLCVLIQWLLVPGCQLHCTGLGDSLGGCSKSLRCKDILWDGTHFLPGREKTSSLVGDTLTETYCKSC